MAMLGKRTGATMMVFVLLTTLSVVSASATAHAKSTEGMLVVPYFSPTSSLWNTIYQQAIAHPGTIKYVIINPCSGPCSGTALSQDWQNVISTLKADDPGIMTVGYIYYTSESNSAIDYYMTNPTVKTDGIFFDGEGSTNHLTAFNPFASYVHSITVNSHLGKVYINPGCNCYSTGYLTSGAADMANIYENTVARLSQISLPAGIAPNQLSAIAKLANSCSRMVGAMQIVSSDGVGNVYVTGSSYTSLPSYFPNEVNYAATGISNC